MYIHMYRYIRTYTFDIRMHVYVHTYIHTCIHQPPVLCCRTYTSTSLRVCINTYSHVKGVILRRCLAQYVLFAASSKLFWRLVPLIAFFVKQSLRLHAGYSSSYNLIICNRCFRLCWYAAAFRAVCFLWGS